MKLEEVINDYRNGRCIGLRDKQSDRDGEKHYKVCLIKPEQIEISNIGIRLDIVLDMLVSDNWVVFNEPKGN